MSIFKYDMLLFGKQILQNRRFAYFVELDTLEDVQPRVHRYRVGYGQFKHMQLGQVFRLEARGITIVRAILEEDEYPLSQIDYELLLELKHMRFGEQGKPFRAPEYFSYSELKALLSYSESLARRLLIGVFYGIVFALCGLLPLLLYSLLIAAGIRFDNPYAAPILAVGALPLLVCVTVLLCTLCNKLFFIWPRTRYAMLRMYALRSGGKKYRMGIAKKDARKWGRTGAVCGGVFVLSLLLALLL